MYGQGIEENESVEQFCVAHEQVINAQILYRQQRFKDEYLDCDYACHLEHICGYARNAFS